MAINTAVPRRQPRGAATGWPKTPRGRLVGSRGGRAQIVALGLPQRDDDAGGQPLPDASPGARALIDKAWTCSRINPSSAANTRR